MPNNLPVALIANIHIANDERLDRMLASFQSLLCIKFSSYQINIRGSKSSQAALLLESFGIENLVISFSQSRNGWSFDTLQLASNTKSPVTFIWIEDHIFVGNPDNFTAFLQEFSMYQVDVASYSMFNERNCQFYSQLFPCKSTQYLSTFFYTTYDFKQLRKYLNQTSILSLYLPCLKPLLLSNYYFPISHILIVGIRCCLLILRKDKRSNTSIPSFCLP